MKFAIPQLFVRFYPCNAETGLKSNSERRTEHGEPLRVSYVVMNPSFSDLKSYDSNWMCNPELRTDPQTGHAILVPDIDLCDRENMWVFDNDDAFVAYCQALRKLKEIWAELEVTE